MESNILFKVRMADRSSVKFILKDKKLYVSVGSEHSDDANSEVGDDYLIEKEKVVILDEISSDEAIDEMELLGHTFYVYRDIDRKATCIVYKRADGTYGLMETR